MHIVEQPQGLLCAFEQKVGLALKGKGATHVHIPKIYWRRALVHPLRQHLAGAAGRLNAYRVKAAGHKKVIKLWGRSQQITVVCGKALRAVEEKVDSRIAQFRKAPDGRFQNRLKMSKIIGQCVEAEILRDSLHAPRFGLQFKAAQQQFSGIVFEISLFVGYAQGRPHGSERLQRLCNQIKVLRGMQGQMNIMLGGEFARPHTASQDHLLGIHQRAVV